LIEYYKLLAGWYRDEFVKILHNYDNNAFDNNGKTQHIVYIANIITTISCYQDLYNIARSIDDNTIKIMDIKADCNEYTDTDKYQSLRNEFKKRVFNEIRDNFVGMPKSELVKYINTDREIIDGLINLLKEFNKRYTDAKTRHNRMDFADLERSTLKILNDGEALKGVRKKYKYIFVDEGQDTNPVQFKIMNKLIGRDKFFYMVGDVKQSIYGFRGCEPDLFKRKIEQRYYEDDKIMALWFNDNFRSNPEILKFVNDIFCKIMKNPKYDTKESFKIKKPYKPETFSPVEVEFIIGAGTAKRGDTKVIPITEPYDIDKEWGGEEINGIDAQIELTVRHIKQLFGQEYWDSRANGYKRFGYGDIAVLAEARSHFKKLADALLANGINCAVDSSVNAAEIPEIAVLNNFLFAAANWTNDLPLVLTMKNIIFGFTDDEIAKIRLADRNSPIIHCIKKYKETGNDENLKKRLTDFCGMLSKYNTLIRDKTTAEVLTAFVTETNYLERLALNGGRAAANAVAFINKIRNIEAAFCVARYLYLIEHGLIKIEINTADGIENSVRIMTIHGSKGLEFPAVILFNVTDDWANKGNKKSPIVVEKDMGICIQSVDTENYIMSNNLLQFAVKKRLRDKELDEKMRLLYVAMTRPRNHLYIIGAKNTINYTPFAKNMFDFIGNASVGKMRIVNINDITATVYGVSKENKNTQIDNEMLARLRTAFAWEYPNMNAAETHIKQSVTALAKEETDSGFAVIPMFDDDRQDGGRGSGTGGGRDGQTGDARIGGNGGAEYGSYFHKQMQYAVPADENVAAAVKIIDDFLAGWTVYRELPFLSKTDDENGGILMQGIIDLLAVRDGKAIIIDYKTTKASEKKLIELYTPQLRLYADAVKKFLPKHGITAYIYSTHHKKLIAVIVR
jgi:ATP-dependent exoDNAse (exonuclease V) beta subunit